MLPYPRRQSRIRRNRIGGIGPFSVAQAAPAGDEAEAVFARGEAEQHYRSALELAERVGDEPAASQALEKLGGALATTVRYGEALTALEQAEIHGASRA